MEQKSTFIEWMKNMKNCIIINRGGKYHVREYSYNVKKGMPDYKAHWYCTYLNDSRPHPYAEFFDQIQDEEEIND